MPAVDTKQLLSPTGTTGQVLTVLAGGKIGPVAAGGGYELIQGKYQATGTSLTITVPANTLTVDGHHLYVEALYESAGIGQGPILQWDGFGLASGSINADGGESALIRAWIHKTGAAAQRLYSLGTDESSAGYGRGGTDAADLTGAVDILATWATPGTNKVLSLKVWKVVL